jgi:hypothetical protein
LTFWKSLSQVTENLDIWIERGETVSPPTPASAQTNAYSVLLANPGMVNFQSNPTGVTVRWVMAAANWSSLIFLQSYIVTLKGPFKLEFFNGGWFNESIHSALDAASRIDFLMMKSDRRFTTRAFTRPVTPKSIRLPDLLRSAFESGESQDDYTVSCAVGRDTGRIIVEKIGHHSTLAKLWGQSDVSFPCRTGNTYDHIVSQPYHDVIRTGQPHYDHVCAAMVQPTGRLDWVSYQRIVFPGPLSADGNPTVRSLCELAPIDISMW